MKDLTIKTEITVEERVAIKMEIDELLRKINKLKNNENYPLDVFVELLDVERTIGKMLKSIYSKYELQNVHYRK